MIIKSYFYRATKSWNSIFFLLIFTIPIPSMVARPAPPHIPKYMPPSFMNFFIKSAPLVPIL